MRARALAAALSAAACLAATHALAVNKCVDKTGKVTYQEDKCPDEAKSNVLKAVPASPRMLSPEEDQDSAQLNTIVWAVSSIERCSQVSPAYARNTAKALEDYRREQAQWFARLERSPRYQQMLRDNRARTAEILKDPAKRQQEADMCGDGK